MGRFLDLGLQPVVEIVVDLLNELLIIQVAKVELAFRFVGHARHLWGFDILGVDGKWGVAFRLVA
jgi:hypothetical protein